MGITLVQPNTFGILAVGLDTTPTGSDASAIMVADFTGSTQTLFPTPSEPTPVLQTNSQTLGTTFKINRDGMYQVRATVQCQTAASVLAAIGLDNIAAELNTNPGPEGARILDRSLRIAAAADTDAVKLVSRIFAVTRPMATDPAQAIVRLLLSNNAGAGAAVASLAIAACTLTITRLGDVPAELISP